MDQGICASLSHTHYWYEVDMLKVPAIYMYSEMIIELIKSSVVTTYDGGDLHILVVRAT